MICHANRDGTEVNGTTPCQRSKICSFLLQDMEVISSRFIEVGCSRMDVGMRSSSPIQWM